MTDSSNPLFPMKNKTVWRSWILKSLVIFGASLLSLYAIFAIDMGRVNIAPAIFGSEQILEQRHQTNKAADTDHSDDPALNQAWQHSGVWLYAMSKVTSDQHSYGTDSYFTYSMYHYAEMPIKNMVVLSFHNVMGGICMLFGALQFWPAFRHRYPRWHRGFGALYMVTAQLAMIAAAIYLTITPVQTIYDSFSFYVGLWILVIIVTISLWLSIYHLKRKEYAQHQAYMAINFGALLTAPILRYNWVLGGILFPDVSFNTSNYWGAGILLPQCFVMGYLLLCLSRSFQKDRPFSLVAAQQIISKTRSLIVSGLIGILLLCLLTNIYYLSITPDLSLFSNAERYIPLGLIEVYNQAVLQHEGLRYWFIVASIGLIGVGICFINASFLKNEVNHSRVRLLAIWLILFGLILGTILMIWAKYMGAPSITTLSGGTHMGLFAVLNFLFVALLAYAVIQNKPYLIREWGLFLILCSVSLPMSYLILHFLMLLPIPEIFIQQGHVYRLAADAGPILLVFGLFYAAYSQATLSKFAR